VQRGGKWGLAVREKSTIQTKKTGNLKGKGKGNEGWGGVGGSLLGGGGLWGVGGLWGKEGKSTLNDQQSAGPVVKAGRRTPRREKGPSKGESPGDETNGRSQCNGKIRKEEGSFGGKLLAIKTLRKKKDLLDRKSRWCGDRKDGADRATRTRKKGGIDDSKMGQRIAKTRN